MPQACVTRKKIPGSSLATALQRRDIDPAVFCQKYARSFASTVRASLFSSSLGWRDPRRLVRAQLARSAKCAKREEKTAFFSLARRARCKALSARLPPTALRRCRRPRPPAPPVVTADLEDGWNRLRKDGIDRLERLLDA